VGCSHCAGPFGLLYMVDESCGCMGATAGTGVCPATPVC